MYAIQSLWFITLKLLISESRIQLFIFVFVLCVMTRQREIYVGLVYEIKISRNQRVPHYHPRLGGSSSLAILIKVTIKLHRYRVWLASFNLPPNSRNGNAVPISKTRLSPPLPIARCRPALPASFTLSQLSSARPFLIPLVNLINVRKLQRLPNRE